MTSLDWERAARRERLQNAPPPLKGPLDHDPRKPITKGQRRYLGILCRDLDRQMPPVKTRLQASIWINHLKQQLQLLRS